LAIAGQQEDTQESMSALVAGAGLVIIFIYLVLASQFASFTQPIAIMAPLPFTLIGVLLALLLTGTTLNILSMIGFVMLMGLVTKTPSCSSTSRTARAAAAHRCTTRCSPRDRSACGPS
jgi:multidrug efflux pump subunit AcrB